MDRTRQNGTVRMALLVLLLYFIIPAPFCQVVFEKIFGYRVGGFEKEFTITLYFCLFFMV